MRARLATLFLPCLSLLVGCGGGGGSRECRAEVQANTAYAGNYVVTYTPEAASSARPVTFDITVISTGFLSGSGTDSATGQSVLLTRTGGGTEGEPSFVGDDNDCEDKAYVRLIFTRSATTSIEEGAVIEEIRGSVKQSGSLVGTYQASDLLGGDTLSSGTLTVSRKPDAVD